MRTGKKKFAPKLSVRTPDSRGKCGFEVKFRKKIDRKFKAISIPQNAFSGHFRGQSPIGALWAPILLWGTAVFGFETKLAGEKKFAP